MVGGEARIGAVNGRGLRAATVQVRIGGGGSSGMCSLEATEEAVQAGGGSSRSSLEAAREAERAGGGV